MAIFVCALAVFFNIYFSTIIHELMSKTFRGVLSLQFGHCISSIQTSSKHFSIFISLQIFVMLGISLLLLNRFGDYTSQMVSVTKDIKTPVSSGQKQHGSARWQSKKEIFRNFSVAKLNKNNQVIQELINHGYDDLQFYKRKGEDKS